MDSVSVGRQAASNIGAGTGCESPAHNQKHESGSRESGDSSPQVLRIVGVRSGREGVDVTDHRVHQDDNDYRNDDTSE